MTRRLGPHAILNTSPSRTWAARAPIAKGMGNLAVLKAAPDDAIRVYRWPWSPAEQDAILDAQDDTRVVAAILGGLAGYRHPLLYVEILNEVGKGRRTQYIALLSKVVPRLHAAGLKVAAPSWGTGDFEQADWDAFRVVRWAGCDAVSLHAYWGAQGLTVWNALRYRTYWRPDQSDPALLLITECGRDAIEQGKGGWKADSLTDEQFLAELAAYDAEIARDPGVYATVFSAGCTQDWRNFDVDPLCDRLAAQGTPEFYRPVSPTPAPQEPPVPDQPTLCAMAMWRQGSDLRAEERTPAGLAAALLRGGYTVAIADVLQGTTPQRTFSKTPIDIGSPAEAATLARALMDRGVRFWPMMNVLGDEIDAEIVALKTYAEAIKSATGETTIVLDFEALYPGFFQPTGSLDAAIRNLVNAVETFFPAGFWTVILCPDPRQIGREYALDLFPAHWHLMPQTYNADFQIGWQECYRRYLPASTTGDLALEGDPTPAAATNYGGRTVIPMLQGDLPTLEMQDMWRWLASHSRWACTWGFGALVPASKPGYLDDFAVSKAVAGPYEALPVVVPVAPPGPPDPASPEVRALIERWWQDTLAVNAAGNTAGAVALQRGVVAAKVALGLQQEAA